MTGWKQFAAVAFAGSLVPIGTIALYLTFSRSSPAAAAVSASPSAVASQAVSSPPTTANPSPSAEASASPRAVAEPSQVGDVMGKARELVASQAPSLKTEKDVDRFLDQLEGQARTRGEVSAMEVEPGLMAIEGLTAQIGPEKAAEKRGKFASQMSELALVSLVALGAVGVAMAPQDAKASSIAYPCNIAFTPLGGSLGNSGNLWVNWYTGPGCTGTYIEQAQYCSVGATDTATCDTSVLYSGPQLLALWENLQRAAAARQKCYEQSTTSSWHVRGLYVQFYSN